MQRNRAIWSRLAVILALLILGLAPTAASARSLSAAERATIEASRASVTVAPAESPADADVTGVVDIAAPPAAVWEVLYDCARAPAVMPDLTRCAVLEAGPGGAWDIREHRVRWISLLPEISSRFRSDYVVNVSIRFRLAGGDLNALDGEWRLEPLFAGSATRLHYRARVGFGALIPSFVIRNALAEDVPKFLEAIRKEAIRGAPPLVAAP